MASHAARGMTRAPSWGNLARDFEVVARSGSFGCGIGDHPRVFFISAQRIAPHPQDVVAFVVHGHKGAFSFRGVGAAHDDSVVSALRRNIGAAEVPPKAETTQKQKTL